MEIQGQSLASRVNYLIAVAEDDKLGYADAAIDAEDATLKKIFLSLSAERGLYKSQLEEQLRILEGKAAVKPSDGVLQREWSDLKLALIHNDTNAVIRECINGEGFVLKEYAIILENIKSESALSKLLVRQRNGINSALNGIKNYLNK